VHPDEAVEVDRHVLAFDKAHFPETGTEAVRGNLGHDFAARLGAPYLFRWRRGEIVSWDQPFFDPIRLPGADCN
jgi:hypothetical protein